ncbi:MAG: cupin domain-containing protein [Alphaproteobacteria bacterium]|nr:cupin domain-containing protein [Alphaproteobacteria bacterium]
MRPAFLKNRREIEGPAASLSAATGLSRLEVMHLRLAPGGRYRPAEGEEEFVFVLQGTPDLRVGDDLHRLGEGDGVAIPAIGGMSQDLINDTDDEVRLFVFGEGRREGGPQEVPTPTAMRRGGRPDHVARWPDILKDAANRYPDSDEDQGIPAPFGRRARFSRIGIHVELLKPGRRTSYPHAERDEDEFVYVVSGAVEAWTDGHTTPMTEGDFIGWEAGTGITHVILNNSGGDAVLLIGGEASRVRNQYWYPFHPERNVAAGENYWADHPLPKLGPHDGLTDALRAKGRP